MNATATTEPTAKKPAAKSAAERQALSRARKLLKEAKTAFELYRAPDLITHYAELRADMMLMPAAAKLSEADKSYLLADDKRIVRNIIASEWDSIETRVFNRIAGGWKGSMRDLVVYVFDRTELETASIEPNAEMVAKRVNEFVGRLKEEGFADVEIAVGALASVMIYGSVLEADDRVLLGEALDHAKAVVKDHAEPPRFDVEGRGVLRGFFLDFAREDGKAGPFDRRVVNDPEPETAVVAYAEKADFGRF